jgi:hypothetical protein
LPFLVSAGLAVTCAETPKPILETSLLAFPNQVTGAARVPSVPELRATVGKVEYEVRSVTPAAGSADLRTVVVLDLSSIPLENQPCLIQKAREMLPAFRRMTNFSLLVVSDEWTEFHKPIRYAPGEMYEYFLPDPNVSTKDRCAPASSSPQSKRRPLSREKQMQTNPGFRGAGAYGGLAARQSFRGLAEALQSERGPVRVFWIGQAFGWIHPWTVSNRYEYDRVLQGLDSSEIAYSPNAAYWWLDAFIRPGISFWPIVWLNGANRQAKGIKYAEQYASEIAQYLGGRARVCNRNIARCLQKQMDASSRGWIVRIAGPPVALPVRYTAATLRLWYGPDPGVLDFKRPFARLEKPGARPGGSIGYRTAMPAMPLFDSTWLPGKAGCGTGSAKETRPYAMTAVVPEAQVRGIRKYVEVLSVSPGPPEKKLTDEQERAAVLGEPMQLHLRTAPELVRTTGRGTAEVCVELPPMDDANGSYRIVLFNPETGWAGVGVLPAADVLRDREQTRP